MYLIPPFKCKPVPIPSHKIVSINIFLQHPFATHSFSMSELKEHPSARVLLTAKYLAVTNYVISGFMAYNSRIVF